MKLLFDENLSPKLSGFLGPLFPDSTHVRECGLRGQRDVDVWEYARASFENLSVAVRQSVCSVKCALSEAKL
jgi:predicted nuclease of predicted toxin-antitoxin system